MTSNAPRFRHPFERPLLYISAVLSLVAFISTVVLVCFKDPVYAVLKSELVAAHAEDHPEVATLSPDA